MKTAAGIGATAVTALATTVVAVGTSFVKSASEVAQYGDSIDKMSQKMGLSAEAYQEWDFIMQHSGTSMETMKASMKTLANAAENSNEAFERLGITQQELATLNQEELFEATIEGLQNVEDTTERTYLAGQLLGRGATELGAVLNMTAEETEMMKQQVHDLGGVMSNDAVKAAAQFQDSLQNMQTAFEGTKRTLIATFLPSMSTVMDGLALVFSGNDSGIGLITKGVNGFTANLTKTIPTVLKVGSGIVNGLVSAIGENLPALLDSGVDVVYTLIDGIIEEAPNLLEAVDDIIETLVEGLAENGEQLGQSAVDLITKLATGLIDNLPQVIEAGMQILLGIVQGLTENIPILIDKVIALIPQIVETLTSPDSLNQIITSGLDLVGALADGLLEAIPALLQASLDLILGLVDYLLNPENTTTIKNAAGDLVTKIGEGLVDFVNNISQSITDFAEKIKEKFSDVDWKTIGTNIVDGIKTGISNAWESFKSWVSEKIEGVVSSVEDALGIESPSKVFARIGRFMVEGLGVGWSDEIDSVTDDITKSLDFSAYKVPTLTASVSTANSTGQSGSSLFGGVTIIQNIYAQEMTAAELMQEAKYRAQQAVIFGV